MTMDDYDPGLAWKKRSNFTKTRGPGEDRPVGKIGFRALADQTISVFKLQATIDLAKIGSNGGMKLSVQPGCSRLGRRH